MTDTFRVRRAGVADADLLAEVGSRTFVAAFAAANHPDDVDAYVADAFSPAQLADELADPASTFLIGYDDARSDGHPVGYARLVGGSAEPGVGGTRPVELARIYVEPAHTGRGYGSKLLAACLDQARAAGFDTIWLGVWEHNHGARRFYERWRFRRVGEHEFVLGSDVQTDHVLARPVRLDDGADPTPPGR